MGKYSAFPGASERTYLLSIGHVPICEGIFSWGSHLLPYCHSNFTQLRKSPQVIEGVLKILKDTFVDKATLKVGFNLFFANHIIWDLGFYPKLKVWIFWVGFKFWIFVFHPNFNFLPFWIFKGFRYFITPNLTLASSSTHNAQQNSQGETTDWGTQIHR